MSASDPGPVQLLFVCTANRIRSPFAAAVAVERVTVLGLPITVDSAGLLEGGEPAVEQMVRAATRHGVDLSPHVSSQVTAPMLEASDLVVTMTGRHVLGLIEIDPTCQHRALTLREWGARSLNGDPITDWTSTAVREWAARATDRPIGALMSEAAVIVDPMSQRWPRTRRTAALIAELVTVALDPAAREART